MDNWFLVSKMVLVPKLGLLSRLGLVPKLLALTVIVWGVYQPTQAIETNQTIRFYKINNKDQADKIRFTAKKARKSGCHNFIKKVRVHRIVQIGYQTCTLYAKKSCDTQSVINAVRSKEPNQKETELTQGYSWFPVDEHKRGARLKSWSCE